MAATLLATGCSKENPFDGPEAEGQFLKSALSVDVKADAIERNQKRTRAEAELDEFTVVFTRQGQTAPAAKYKYGEMPEVVTLPEGNYTVTALYGEDRPAEWENPYYKGVSDAFEVKAYEITSYVEPIECRLENIMVSISFDSALAAIMSPDSYVEVKVGANDALNFTTAEATLGKAGYFRHTEENTLVATFIGKVDGVETVETKSYTDVRKGYHYRLTFAPHRHDNDPTGDVDSEISVDGSVTIINVETNVELGDDPLLADTDRPTENPVEPTPDEPKEMDFTAEAPINLDGVNYLTSGDKCELHIVSFSEGGFTALTCDIESPSLTPAELANVGLASHLDLVNTPADMAEVLEGLGFPVNVGGKKKVDFSLTDFVPLLAAFAGVEHHFVISATDANGTVVKTLKLVCE